MKNFKLWLYRGIILGLAILLVSAVGILRVEAATSIDDTDADTSVDVEATSDEDVIHFNTFGSERMTIKSDGKIGIGTTTPTQLLEVNGTLKVDDIQIGDNSIRVGQGGGNTIVITGGDGDITTEAGDNLTIETGTAVDPGDFLINATSGGHVGIGTATPAADLHVNGTSQFGGVINTDNNWISGDGGAEGIYIADDGKVGVGTSTPGQALEVNGAVKVGAYTLPATDGTNGQVLQTNGSGALTWTASGGTETNSLETVATGIASGEIPIGTSTNTATYTSISGDATMTSAGVVSVSDVTITGEAAEDFLVYDGTNWVAKGGIEKINYILFSRDMSSSTTTQSVTGVGFKPSALVITALENFTRTASIIGFADATTGNPGGTSVFDNVNSSNTYEYGGGVIHVEDSSGNYLDGYISSYDSDGFEVTWTKTGSPTGTLTIIVLAFR